MSVETSPYTDQYGEVFDLLPVGTRIRSKQHPTLTGRIDRYEWHSPGNISPIPYAIAWDDPGAAYRTLGMFASWGTPSGIEALP